MAEHVPFDEEELLFLNNCWCHFILGEKATIPQGPYRTHHEDDWDIPMCTSIRCFEQDIIDYYHQECSDKKLGQTPAEFYAELDKTIVEVGLSVDLVAETISAYLVERKTNHSAKIEPFLAPIYKAFRLKGYNRLDLWG
jgi:hypothetical protein